MGQLDTHQVFEAALFAALILEAHHVDLLAAEQAHVDLLAAGQAHVDREAHVDLLEAGAHLEAHAVAAQHVERCRMKHPHLLHPRSHLILVHRHHGTLQIVTWKTLFGS